MSKEIRMPYIEYQQLLMTIKEQAEVIDKLKDSDEVLLYRFKNYYNKIYIDGNVYKISIPIIIDSKTEEYQRQIGNVIKKFENMIETLEDITEENNGKKIIIKEKVEDKKHWLKKIFRWE